MGLLDLIFKGRGHGIDELARRLGIEPRQLKKLRPAYREFRIPKRNGNEQRQRTAA